MALTQFSPRAVRTSSTTSCISENVVAAVTVLLPVSDSVPTKPSALDLKMEDKCYDLILGVCNLKSAIKFVLTVSLKVVSSPVMVSASESSTQAPSIVVISQEKYHNDVLPSVERASALIVDPPVQSREEHSALRELQ